MNEIIKNFYKTAGVMPILIDNKLDLLDRNKDIKEEFEYWICNNTYTDNVNVGGYTASKLAGISPYLKGEGAFMMLIELRENPERAKKRIEKGFQIK